MDIAQKFTFGTLVTSSALEPLGTTEFVPHKTFPGVALKLLVSGEKTDHALSIHLVRVDPHCCLDHHTHPENLEIHQVISGSGTALIGERISAYGPGTIGVIPTEVSHRVTAGDEGLYILATFSPALV